MYNSDFECKRQYLPRRGCLRLLEGEIQGQAQAGNLHLRLPTEEFHQGRPRCPYRYRRLAPALHVRAGAGGGR